MERANIACGKHSELSGVGVGKQWPIYVNSEEGYASEDTGSFYISANNCDESEF